MYLPERSLFDQVSQTFSDIVPDNSKWHRFAWDTLIDGHDVETVTRLDEGAENSRRPEFER